MQVGNAKVPQVGFGFVMQTLQPFHAVHLFAQPTQHSRLVTTAGANFKHPPCWQGLALQQQLQHAGHHIGLGNGLPQSNGQAGVFVGLVHQRTVHKAVALHLAHGLQHRFIGNALCGQFAHHGGPNGR